MSQRAIEYVLISAPKVHWRVQPTAARRSGRFNTMLSTLKQNKVAIGRRQRPLCPYTLRALHVSLNNVSTRTVRKWLKLNNGHLITFRIWMV